MVKYIFWGKITGYARYLEIQTRVHIRRNKPKWLPEGRAGNGRSIVFTLYICTYYSNKIKSN